MEAKMQLHLGAEFESSEVPVPDGRHEDHVVTVL